MPTNDRKINLYHKRLLSLTAVKNNFLDYLQGAIDEVGTAFFAGASGTLDADKIGMNNSHGGSTFDIDTAAATSVIAANHTIDLTKITGAGKTHTIPFENTAATVYWAGVFFAEVEDGVEVNPRTGDPEYTALKQSFGNVDHPTSVTDHTSYIRVNVNSITESGVDHSGRSVKVWLVDPVHPLDSVAFFTGTIAYSAPNNYIDIPYSGANGPLGQDTSSEAPSTTAADYKVFIEGVTWRKNTDLRGVAACAVLGKITGGTPPTFDTGDQVNLQIISLDRAYDGIPGPGGGRKIWVDAGAVEFVTETNGTDDEHNAQFRLTRIENTDAFQLGLEFITDSERSVPIGIFEPLACSTYLNATETANLSGETVTFTRPTNLAHSSVALDAWTHLLWVRSGTQKGLYGIDSCTATEIVARSLQTGASPAWSSETGVTCTILQPRMIFSNKYPAYDRHIRNWRGLTLTGRTGKNEQVGCLTLLPDGSMSDIIVAKSNRVDAAGVPNPREALWLDADGRMAGSPGMQLNLGQWLGDLPGENNVSAPCGLKFAPYVVGSGGSRFSFNVMPCPHRRAYGGLPSARIIGLHNDDEAGGVEIQRWEVRGRWADSHRFVEPFNYRHGTLVEHMGGQWDVVEEGDGGVYYHNSVSTNRGQASFIHLATEATSITDGIYFKGPHLWSLMVSDSDAGNAPYTRNLNFYGRLRIVASGTFQNVFFGITTDTFLNNFVIFERDAPDSGTYAWRMHSRVDGTSSTGAAGAEDRAGDVLNNLGWKDFYFKIIPGKTVATCEFWMTGMASASVIDLKTGGLGTLWDDFRFAPIFGTRSNFVGDARRIEVDHIEIWDECLQAGPKE